MSDVCPLKDNWKTLILTKRDTLVRFGLMMKIALDKICKTESKGI